ncbi:hypothetical protein H0H81_008975, partial [Sphagnurus paluster]
SVDVLVIRISAFSGDAVYLYSTYDDPEDENAVRRTSSLSSLLIPNAQTHRNHKPVSVDTDMDFDDGVLPTAADVDSNITDELKGDNGEDSVDEEGDDQQDYLEVVDGGEIQEDDYCPHVPVVLPRQRFAGTRNGDGSVVNMIEGHPHLPLVAVSGIDHTVKLFAPSRVASQFSRMSNAARIMESNARPNRPRSMRISLAALLAETRLAMGSGSVEPECRSQ